MSDHKDIYLRPREAAEFLRTSTSTLAKRRLNGDGPKFCRIGRAIRYRKSDLDEFMVRSRVQSTSDTSKSGVDHASSETALQPKQVR
jgi:predicted DNA-binding transcriptional regulator AlpA